MYVCMYYFYPITLDSFKSQYPWYLTLQLYNTYPTVERQRAVIWFLKIAFVHKVSMHACMHVCVCVCVCMCVHLSMHLSVCSVNIICCISFYINADRETSSDYLENRVWPHETDKNTLQEIERTCEKFKFQHPPTYQIKQLSEVYLPNWL